MHFRAEVNAGVTVAAVHVRGNCVDILRFGLGTALEVDYEENEKEEQDCCTENDGGNDRPSCQGTGVLLFVVFVFKSKVGSSQVESIKEYFCWEGGVEVQVSDDDNELQSCGLRGCATI